MYIMNAKEKLNIFEVRAAQWVMIDLLQHFDKLVHRMERDKEEYIKYITDLKNNYTRELEQGLKDYKNVKQIDLEDSIREIQNETK